MFHLRLVRPMPHTARRRLNGWIRIGIVLSVLWMLYVCGVALFEYMQHRPYTSNFIEWRGTKTGESYTSLAKTTGQFADLVPLSASLRLRWFAAALFAPVAVFWFAAFTLVYATRWIIRGFTRQKA